MQFLSFLFYAISSGLFLMMLGEKFEWKSRINKTQKGIADVIFKVQIIALTIIEGNDDIYFLRLSVPFLVVMLIYLYLYKEGTILEKIYWVTLVKCISSCAMLISLLILKYLEVDKLYAYMGNAAYILIIIFILLAEYFSLSSVTKASPKLTNLGSSALIWSTLVNVFWIFVFRMLEAIANLKFLLIAAVLLLLSYIVYFLIMNLLSKNVEELLDIKLKNKYYEEVELINKEVRKYRHDLSNHLNMLYYFIDTHNFEEAKQYLDSMSIDFNKINQSFYFINTKNKAVDYMLNSKLLVAREKGIEVKASVGLMENLYVSDTDLCTLLGNLLDNSIEACQLFEKANPFIRVNIQLVKKNFMINIKNSSNPVKTDEEGNYITNKKTGDHGLGMLQINRIIKQYQGFISRKYEDDVFETDIVLFKPVE